eukprot:CAMPEP_0202797180 /NCGR_PEP_ID=MMETSP1388-20130828/93618_1 /ASSEMBLY_ACC=CAM_ASM_000864 /TAXON_ID=37098 /ORGANISM="Isochrysis sp, Strain CCMP1244" /LENGTH=105 /DNA_ID=CAMNT_0049467089 /DNA_START=118 /DNA_END=435 /DNA_ORIENTATION=-
MAPLAASAKGIAQLPIEEDRGDEGEHGGGADEAAPTPRQPRKEVADGLLRAAQLVVRGLEAVRGAEELLPLVTERAEDVGADTLRALGRELCAAQRLLGVLVTGG